MVPSDRRDQLKAAGLILGATPENDISNLTLLTDPVKPTSFVYHHLRNAIRPPRRWLSGRNLQLANLIAILADRRVGWKFRMKPFATSAHGAKRPVVNDGC
jgi:hypothetical protein